MRLLFQLQITSLLLDNYWQNDNHPETMAPHIHFNLFCLELMEIFTGSFIKRIIYFLPSKFYLQVNYSEFCTSSTCICLRLALLKTLRVHIFCSFCLKLMELFIGNSMKMPICFLTSKCYIQVICSEFFTCNSFIFY